MAIDVKNLACAQMGLVGMSEYNMMQFQITGFFFLINLLFFYNTTDHT